MIRIEQLTKEDFWNDMLVKYPAAMELFCHWVDNYKIVSDWSEVFYNGYEQGPGHVCYIKYHHIPGELQFGIFCCFLNDQVQLGNLPKKISITFDQDNQKIMLWRKAVIDTFTYLQQLFQTHKIHNK